MEAPGTEGAGMTLRIRRSSSRAKNLEGAFAFAPQSFFDFVEDRGGRQGFMEVDCAAPWATARRALNPPSLLKITRGMVG